ncbi:MAG: hypothetical protein NZ925_05425 [Sulfolobales archaeon]|nr:hypothetical protein [Sulfolobales archaeon]
MEAARGAFTASTRNVTVIALSRMGPALSRDLVDGVLSGIADPDRVPDRMIYVSARGRGRVVVRECYASHHDPERGLVDYYFNLSLYYLRRGDSRRAGFMLGRALHYVQDGSLSRSRYLLRDVHKAEEKALRELASTPQKVEEVCREVSVEDRKKSSRAPEALCIALRESVNILESFSRESAKNVDAARLREKVGEFRLVKVLTAAALLLSIPIHQNLLLAFITILATAVVALYRPEVYYEAMRAGLMVVKPYLTNRRTGEVRGLPTRTRRTLSGVLGAHTRTNSPKATELQQQQLGSRA